jgi:excisionase family DNA binding protein
LEEASERLEVSHKVVRRLIDSGKISATQVVPCAPWEISAEAVESEEVLQAVRNAKRRVRVGSSAPETVLPMFVEL